ncbi:MAG TPA: co-chaperone GroES [Calditrichae bacterium]|nr:co-chaperone GroES [Calditrichia bacterium]
MKVQPIDDRLLIEPVEETEERVGNIIIPDTAKEKPRMGTVVAVGTDEDIKEIFKEGDRVLFAKYAGEEIKLDGKEYLIVQRSDVLAIVRD